MLKTKLPLRPYDYAVIALLFLFSAWFQSHVYFNWDASWHLEAAKRIAQGGASYSKNLFDDNLPMVFWFFVPAVFLHHMTSIPLLLLCNLSVYCVVLLSFILSGLYLKDRAILYTLLISLLFFPGFEFAQRDMLVTAFFLPYVVLAVNRVEKTRLLEKSYWLPLLIGLFAAVGIAMNPYYGLMFVAIEIQQMCCLKKIPVRIELIAFVFGMFFYFLMIFLFYPDYYTLIIPSYLAFSLAYNASWHHLLLSQPALFTMGAVVIFILLRLNSVISLRTNIFFLALIMACAVYLINGKLWLSHVIFLFVCLNLFLVSAFYDVILIRSFLYRVIIGLFLAYILICACFFALFRQVELYQHTRSQKTVMHQLITYFNRDASHNTFFYFGTRSTTVFPMINYTTLHYLSPWPDCWAIRATEINLRRMNQLPLWKQKRIRSYKKTFMSQVIQIFQTEKPQVVMVDIKKEQGGVKDFEFIPYLTKNPEFKKLWMNYRLTKVISHYEIFKLIARH